MFKIFKTVAIALCVTAVSALSTLPTASAAEPPNQVQIADVGASVFGQRYNAIAAKLTNTPVGANFKYDSSDENFDYYIGRVNQSSAVGLMVNKAGYVSMFMVFSNDFNEMMTMTICGLTAIGYDIRDENDKENVTRLLNGLQLNSREQNRWSWIKFPQENRIIYANKILRSDVKYCLKFSAYELR